MLAARTHPHLRRTTCVVLVAWLCVLLASVWAPVARAQMQAAHAVHLCSGELAPPEAPSPMDLAGQDMALHHVLDCPLCLPVLAPPPQEVEAAAVAPPGMLSLRPKARVQVPQRVALPPVRAPPAKTWMSV